MVLGLVLVALMWANSLLGLGGPDAAALFTLWIFDAAFLIAAVTCLLTALIRPDLRLIAGALGLGLLSFMAGSVIYSMAPDPDAVPVPSISDPLWLAIYPLEYVALLLMIRRKVGHTLLATRLDGLQCGLAVAAVMSCFTLPTAFAGAAGPDVWYRMTSLAYPIADLVLLGAVVSAVALAGWRIDRVWGSLAAAIAAWVAADVIYLFGVESLIAYADPLVVTGGLGLAATITLWPDRSIRPPRGGNRGLFVPVGFGTAALAVLVLGVPLRLNGIALDLAGVSLLLALLRMTVALKENRGLLGVSVVEATTDALTGLRNRRKLKADLADVLRDGLASTSHILVLLDLNGFKAYNDAYGHGAGDDLLARLGSALDNEVGRDPSSGATAYRLGGDEFCVLAPSPPDVAGFAVRCAEALSEAGTGFSITAACGVAILPKESHEPVAALALADARMYQSKRSNRLPAARQSADVLLALLQEQAPDLAEHMRVVGMTAYAIAVELGVDGEELEAVRHAAALHDIGKMAIPNTILDQPRELSDAEQHMVRRHTMIGERILAAAPALTRSARLVRSSHERVDGGGYPDGLRGEEIPLGSRIIFVANAYDAMVSIRPYAPARSTSQTLAELRRCAGTQFDYAVVEALERVMQSQHARTYGNVAAGDTEASEPIIVFR